MANAKARTTPPIGVTAKNPRLSKQDLMTQIGMPGLQAFGGYVQESALSRQDISLETATQTGTQWALAIKRMLDTDALMGGILFSLESLIRQVAWHMEPADESPAADEHATFVQSCLDDMSQTWSDTVSEIMTMIPYGWSYMEQVYKVRGGAVDDPMHRSKYDDGRIGWRKWVGLAQETLLRWEFDTDGGTQGLWQIAPPYYDITYIPIDKALLFRTTTRKNNPEGRSLVRNAWRSYYYRTNIEKIEAIGVERDLAGLPVILCPPDVLDTSNPNPLYAALRASFASIVQGVKRGERDGLIFPAQYDEHGNLLYEFKLLSTGGTRQFDTSAIITRYKVDAAMSLLADFVLVGHEGSGTQALIKDKSALFKQAIGYLLDLTCGVINNHAVPRLLRLNPGMDVSLAPKLAHGDIADIDLAAMASIVTALGAASKSPLFADPNSEASRTVLRAIGVPVPEDVADDAPDASGAVAVTPQTDTPNDTDSSGDDDAEGSEVAI